MLLRVDWINHEHALCYDRWGFLLGLIRGLWSIALASTKQISHRERLFDDRLHLRMHISYVMQCLNFWYIDGLVRELDLMEGDMFHVCWISQR